MAPLPDSRSIRSYLNTFLKRTPLPTTPSVSPKLARLAARAENLVRRNVDPGAGVTPPTSIPNNAIFALFGIIGVGLVVTGIWFFFWAKNGGFYFKENDWDDYKSTVLRRKGPNGTTLSGATESTDLGGGSVVHGENDEKRSMWGRRKKGGKGRGKRYKDFDEESSEMTGSALGTETVVTETKSRWKLGRKDKKKKQGRLRGGDLASEMTENTEMIQEEEVLPSVEDAMRAYRHERPARVGGINKESDGSAWDGSTNDNSTSAASDLLSNRERTPTTTPTKIKKQRNDTYTGGTGGIRKVVSTSAGGSGGSNFWSRASGGTSTVEDENHIKSEARKLQEKGRAAQRRDFSFKVGDDSTVDGSLAEERRIRREEREMRRASRSPTKKPPGGYYAESDIGSAVSSDVGTKSYHHPIPGLSSTAGSEYADERRKKRAGGGGYRRGRRDSLSDDGN
ncbi:Uncharacterized protein BP5553_10401 [Venustampulla echinocandica]|uniref:Endosomal spry domain-containing protein n=1 Tax=Venustampulla echinocandica TaxID=2656787 RepID=A0A370T983_9HELO|nr:Uncharacterized protein BP5553_10401 [Venustampulla echinocandica]RDL30123.1 Uncharacterized protein BP5553_10401 [Venustampulla echinocandica]